jgi:hypothetical protein
VTADSAILVNAIMTKLTLDGCIFAYMTLLSMSTKGGYVYVAENPGENHIMNSVFSNAVVLYFFSCVYFCFVCLYLYLYLFFFFSNRRLKKGLFT